MDLEEVLPKTHCGYWSCAAFDAEVRYEQQCAAFTLNYICASYMHIPPLDSPKSGCLLETYACLLPEQLHRTVEEVTYCSQLGRWVEMSRLLKQLTKCESELSSYDEVWAVGGIHWDDSHLCEFFKEDVVVWKKQSIVPDVCSVLSPSLWDLWPLICLRPCKPSKWSSASPCCFLVISMNPPFDQIY